MDMCVGKQQVAWKEYCSEYWLKELQESMDRCVGKQSVAWKEYCSEYWLKELQESMDRCDITEILFKPALNTIQSIHPYHADSSHYQCFSFTSLVVGKSFEVSCPMITPMKNTGNLEPVLSRSGVQHFSTESRRTPNIQCYLLCLAHFKAF